MSRLIQRQIWVQASPIHGRGVFAGEPLTAGEIIEECHTLPVTRETRALCNYVFKSTDTESVLPLGAGAIYNHADSPNAKFKMDPDRAVLIVQATRPIEVGEEIFISYGKDWFDSRRIQPMQRSSWYRFKRWLTRSVIPRGGLVLLMITLGTFATSFFG